MADPKLNVLAKNLIFELLSGVDNMESFKRHMGIFYASTGSNNNVASVLAPTRSSHCSRFLAGTRFGQCRTYYM